MNDDEIIDKLLKRITFDNALPFWPLYWQQIEKHTDLKIDSILEEMLSANLIKKDPIGNDDIPVVALTKYGNDVKGKGGWITYKIHKMSDGEKVHKLLGYVFTTDPKRFDWKVADLIPAFNNALDEYEVQSLCETLIENDDAKDNGTKDGFSIGFIERTKSAYGSKKYLKGGQSDKSKGSIINQITGNTFQGPYVSSLNTGDNNNINQTVKISQGDIQGVRSALESVGVQEDDITELEEIITTEAPNAVNKTFGSRTNSWIQKMIGKTLDKSWDIGTGAAGGILTELLKKYFGL